MADQNCATCNGTGISVVVKWLGGPNRTERPCYCTEDEGDGDCVCETCGGKPEPYCCFIDRLPDGTPRDEGL